MDGPTCTSATTGEALVSIISDDGCSTPSPSRMSGSSLPVPVSFITNLRCMRSGLLTASMKATYSCLTAHVKPSPLLLIPLISCLDTPLPPPLRPLLDLIMCPSPPLFLPPTNPLLFLLTPHRNSSCGSGWVVPAAIFGFIFPIWVLIRAFLLLPPAS